MEDQRQDKMESDIEELKGSLEKLIDLIQAQTAARENPTPNPEVPQITTRVVEPPRPYAFWPDFGLPQGFVPSFVPVPEVGKSTQQTPMVVKPRQKKNVEEPLIEEDPQYMFQVSKSKDGGMDEVDNVKYQTFEKRLRAIEGNDVFGAASMDMCLVPDLVLPAKFKAPDFEKYEGHTFPKTHLVMYIRKMAAYSRNDKLLIHCFQDSLSGASMKWYMSLEKTHIQSWADLADAFMKQYKYNLDMAPYSRQLQSLSKNDKESFKEYAQKWRELAAQVDPPIFGKEVTRLFMDTLPPIYWEKMLGGVTLSFADLVTIGGLVEDCLKSGKIAHEASYSNGPKKFGHKKEGETNAVSNQRRGPRQGMRNNQNYVAVVAPIINQQWAQAPENNVKKIQRRTSFDPIPMTYNHFYLSLIQRGLVTPRGYTKSPPNPPPAWHDPQKHCAFHEGAVGHDLEGCYELKSKVRDLIEADILSFKDMGPNVKTNPMPNH